MIMGHRDVIGTVWRLSRGSAPGFVKQVLSGCGCPGWAACGREPAPGRASAELTPGNVTVTVRACDRVQFPGIPGRPVST